VNSKKLLNPFPVSVYQGPDYFCDREKETSQLTSNIRAGISSTLISIRRIGKTGLIKHMLSRLPQGCKGIYIDILETENIHQFLNHLGTALLKVESESTATGRKIWKFIKSLRPVITFETLTGAPQASFDLKPDQTEQSIDSILHFLDSQSFKTIIAIDEFQQITNYPEKNIDSWLRTRIQQIKNTVFIFSGSQQHLMSELFASPNRPFFRSTSIMKLERLDFNVYRDFIIAQFDRYNKEISHEISEEILVWGDRYTYYIQMLCNRVFAATSKRVTAEIWKQQVYELLKEHEIVFFGYRNMLTRNQWRLLKAIAQEGKVFEPTGKEFLSRYGLLNSASVLRSLQSLLKYELIFRDFDSNGKQFYNVYDVFFQKWCLMIQPLDAGSD
jgi:DNA-binding MarR family transcriptional regulator